jgi:hypothetical protein
MVRSTQKQSKPSTNSTAKLRKETEEGNSSNFKLHEKEIERLLLQICQLLHGSGGSLESEEQELGLLDAAESLIPLLGDAASVLFPEAMPVIQGAKKLVPGLLDLFR